MNRKEVIKRHLEQEYKLLAFYEDDLMFSDDPKRTMRNENAQARTRIATIQQSKHRCRF